MNDLTPLIKRARKTPFNALVKESGLSRGSVFNLLTGKQKNPRLDTIMALEKAVTKLEADATKTKSSGKTAKKHTASRDTGKTVVAGGSK